MLKIGQNIASHEDVRLSCSYFSKEGLDFNFTWVSLSS